MTSFNEERVNAIVQRVLSQWDGGRNAGPSSQVEADALKGDGIFADMDAAVAAARRAQEELMARSLEERERMIGAMRAITREHADELAEMACRETGMGRPEDKAQKNRLVAAKTPGTEILQPRAYTGDRGLTLIERAPYGVVGAITPSTNPTSSIICNAIGLVAAGNSVVFNVHPGAKSCSARTVSLLNQAIVQADGPAGLLASLAEPTIESAQALMRHAGIRLLLVTGGPGVVREAMHSGKKAICAGPGNPPAVVDETANLTKAAQDIVAGASFDCNLVCILEKEIIAVDSIADALKNALEQAGAVRLESWQLARLMKHIMLEDNGPGKHGVINKAFVGKMPAAILRSIGMTVDERVRLAFAEVDNLHPLVWTEQLMPIIPLTRSRSADEAIDLAVAVEQKMGHTAVMHSLNIEKLSRMARLINCSIFIKNGPSLAGLGFGGEGYTSFSIASPTGEGLTNAMTFTRERRCTLVDSFRIV